MTRPLIGITCYVEPATRGDWKDVPSVVLPHDYVRQVEEAGGTILVIPPRSDLDPEAADEAARDVVARLDGLVIAGGADVDPALYAADRHPDAQEARPDRDAMEVALARAAADADLPLLGICRGMQVMAVAAGGTLEQHVPDRVGHVDHSPEVAVYGRHPVDTVPGTLVADVLGETTEVPSYHHQSVLTHPGFEPSAWAPDGTLEAMEDPGARFRLGVQWHPEVGDDPRLFEALVAAAQERLTTMRTRGSGAGPDLSQ